MTDGGEKQKPWIPDRAGLDIFNRGSGMTGNKKGMRKHRIAMFAMILLCFAMHCYILLCFCYELL